jgi:hypothetical protein
MAPMNTAAYTGSSGRLAHSCISSTTLSVIREQDGWRCPPVLRKFHAKRQHLPGPFTAECGEDAA